MPWLMDVEKKFAKEYQEAIPSDAKKIQKRIETVKVVHLYFVFLFILLLRVFSFIRNFPQGLLVKVS